ncbi:hypothetical protein [Agaribacterium sp. ZY112]|uniref:hypothetical protein n=1 Tax=Agaribacterium sp. ZY112 TaxID=3233574 RepID=UPI0035260185
MSLNLVYGLLVLVSAMYISRFYEKAAMPMPRRLLLAGLSQFLFLIALGAAFSLANIGFFNELMGLNEKVLRVVGMAAFVTLLVVLKVWNKSRELD